MSKILSILLIFTICLNTLFAIDVSYNGNVTWTGQATSNSFQFRRTALHALSVPLVLNGAFFSSLSASASENGAALDALWGSTYCGFTNPPTSTLGFFNSSVDFSSVTDWIKWNVSASAGFIGSQFIAVVEKDQNGNVVTTRSLGLVGWTVTDVSNIGTLKYVTFKGVSLDNFQILVTFILSDVIGKLNYGDAVVTPRSIESIVEIPNYPYKDPKNSISLVVGVVSGSASVQSYFSANAVQSGSGKDQVYVAFANTAKINGVDGQVKIDVVLANDTVLPNKNLVIQAQMKYSAGFDIRLFTISFPPGVSSIVYDPTMGSGIPPQALEPVPFPIWGIVLIVVGSLVVIAAVVIAIVLVRRNQQNYTSL